MRGWPRMVRRFGRVAASVLTLITVGQVASAQTYELSWWTVDAGGWNGATTPGAYQFFTTAGQPDAGGPFTGTTFVIHSGFWALVASGGGGPQADVAATISHGQATAAPGLPVTYRPGERRAGKRG